MQWGPPILTPGVRVRAVLDQYFATSSCSSFDATANRVSWLSSLSLTGGRCLREFGGRCRFVTSMRALPGIFGAACVVEVIQRAFFSWWGLGIGCTIQFKSSFLRVHVQSVLG